MLTFNRADNKSRGSAARSPDVTLIDDENKLITGRRLLIRTAFQRPLLL